MEKLETTEICIVGYFDNVRGVNLDALLEMYFENGEIPECAADHTQIVAIAHGDKQLEKPGYLLKLLKDFENCQHLKVWHCGESLTNKELKDALALAKQEQ